MKAIITTIAALFAVTAFAAEPAKKEEKKAEAAKVEKKAEAPKTDAKADKKPEAKK
jgi:hypothetical protein